MMSEGRDGTRCEEPSGRYKRMKDQNPQTGKRSGNVQTDYQEIILYSQNEPQTWVTRYRKHKTKAWYAR